MHYDPIHPTVAGLLAARRSTAFFRTRSSAGPGPEGLLVEALSSALRPGASLVRRPAIDTPFGAVAPLVAVVSARRRLAVLGEDDDRSYKNVAALVLVYGTFDAVYMVSREDLLTQAPRVAARIVESEYGLFSPFGRRALGLCALSGSAAEDRRPEPDRPAVAPHRFSFPRVRRLRLNRPAEWADAFEVAVGAPYARSA